MLTLAHLALSVAMIAAAVGALRTRSLVNAAICLALGNSCLALLFFLLQAPYAGSVQISVGAGVLSAFFIVAISLTESMRTVRHHEE